MKFILFLLFPIFCNAQYVARNEIDEFTGDRKIQVNCTSGKKWREGDKISQGILKHVFLTGQYISFKNSDSTQYFFTLNLKNIYVDTCLSKETGKTILLFEDKSTVEASQISDTECDLNNLQAKYYVTISDIEILGSKNLSKIRIYTTGDKYFEYEILESKQGLIKNTFAILRTTACKVVK